MRCSGPSQTWGIRPGVGPSIVASSPAEADAHSSLEAAALEGTAPEEERDERASLSTVRGTVHGVTLHSPPARTPALWGGMSFLAPSSLGLAKGAARAKDAPAGVTCDATGMGCLEIASLCHPPGEPRSRLGRKTRRVLLSTTQSRSRPTDGRAEQQSLLLQAPEFGGCFLRSTGAAKAGLTNLSVSQQRKSWPQKPEEMRTPCSGLGENCRTQSLRANLSPRWERRISGTTLPLFNIL